MFVILSDSLRFSGLFVLVLFVNSSRQGLHDHFHQIFEIFLFYGRQYIEDICFFEVNTKYISSSELKTSKFSRVHSTSENLDVFKSRDEIYLVFTDKK